MSDPADRHPVGTVLGSMEIASLPAGWTPLEGIVLVKCLDEDGRSSWAFRTTEGVNDEELIGALTVRLDMLRQETLAAYVDDEDDA